jgi:hypothetical protein
MAQRHTEETKICLFDDLEEETEMDVEDSEEERGKDNDEASLYSWSFNASYERFTQGWSGEGPTVLSTAVSNDTVGS